MKILQADGVWTVPLIDSHGVYKQVKLKRRHGDDVTRVVVVNTNNFII